MTDIAYRTDAATAAPGDAGVWVVNDGPYRPVSLTPVARRELSFLPGEAVVFSPDLLLYAAGQPGVVAAVGAGKGVRLGELVYDVEVCGDYEYEGKVERVVASALQEPQP